MRKLHTKVIQHKNLPLEFPNKRFLDQMSSRVCAERSIEQVNDIINAQSYPRNQTLDSDGQMSFPAPVEIRIYSP